MATVIAAAGPRGKPIRARRTLGAALFVHRRKTRGSGAARWLQNALGLIGLAILLSTPSPAAEVRVTLGGWHSGLVVARADLPAGRIPELRDVAPEAHWIEFSWGSAAYFPLRDPGPFDAMRAISGSAAVLHVVGLDRPAGILFPEREEITLSLDPAGFDRLIGRIDASFARDGRPATPGLYPFSRFYPATGRFTLGHTCNTWTAEILADAGVAIDPNGVVEVEDLRRALRP